MLQNRLGISDEKPGKELWDKVAQAADKAAEAAKEAAKEVRIVAQAMKKIIGLWTQWPACSTEPSTSAA
jgi:hypothetical protein